LCYSILSYLTISVTVTVFLRLLIHLILCHDIDEVLPNTCHGWNRLACYGSELTLKLWIRWHFYRRAPWTGDGPIGRHTPAQDNKAEETQIRTPYVPWVAILNSFLFIPLFHDDISATDVFFASDQYNRMDRDGYGEMRTAWAPIPTFTCKVWGDVQRISARRSCPRPRF
jgi:hypothetical protein